VLKELFGQIGKVRKAFIHLGPTGKSTGVADVIFDNSRDADRALTTYNNIELDRTFSLLFLLRMNYINFSFL
jgi:THO complex subunit 4